MLSFAKVGLRRNGAAKTPPNLERFGQPMTPAYMELIVGLAFVAGWLVLEWVGRRLDREKAARERLEKSKSDSS